MNQSTNLVKYTSADLERAEIVTDSKIVAKNAQIEHKSVRLQIDKHLKALQVFGKLEFSDVKSINPQGGRPEKIYLLNEHQAMLLFTFLKNTATVVKFKVKLVKMFALMQPRDRFQGIVKSSDVLFWKRGQTPFSKPIPYCNPGILNLSTTSPVSRSTSIAFFVSLSTMSFPVAIWKRAFKKVIP